MTAGRAVAAGWKRKIVKETFIELKRT